MATVAALVALVGVPAAQARPSDVASMSTGASYSTPDAYGGGLVDRENGSRSDGPSAAERVAIEQRIKTYEASHPAVATGSRPTPYPFYPQAGNVWQDLFIGNFVDLDPIAGSMKDFDCTGYTYDGHNGLDIGLRSFREQLVGVPVFSALDGTVVDAHDGEPDMNTSGQNVPANYIVIDDGSGQQSLYWHLKKGSVAVAVGQTVRAGQQIGLTGSSGMSTGPHLHFESHFSGSVYEPDAGPCRSGASNWVHQLDIRRDTYAEGFLLSSSDLSGNRGDPWDLAVRTPAFAPGSRTVYVKSEINNIPARSNFRVALFDPSGNLATYYASSFNNSDLYRQGWWWWSIGAYFDANGTWTAEIDINGAQVVRAPFTVNNNGTVANRPPDTVAAALDPTSPQATDAIFCRITPPSLAVRDPDFDVVSYRYHWLVNSSTVRDVTSAGLADAIPARTASTGDTVTCQVTANDGHVNGATTSASATVGVSNLPPTISSFSPSSGITGARVTINGSHFTGTTKVVVGSNKARFSVNTDNQIVATVANGAASGKITVTNTVGSTVSNSNYTVTFSITKISPTSGPVATTVTITGVGFNKSTVIKFNGLTASNQTHNSSTLMTAVVPRGTTSGVVSATNTTGATGTVKGQKFSVS